MTRPDSPEREAARRVWEALLTGDHGQLGSEFVRPVLGRLPATHRCRICQAPFDGISGWISHVVRRSVEPSEMNPTVCGRCEALVKRHEVGVEVEITMLFADVRGSSALAETLGPSEFHRVIDRFYRLGIDVFIESGALVEKLIGDEIAGLYTPGIAGADHASRAVRAASDLLLATGHGSGSEPWLPVGAGVHTGRVYIGAVGTTSSMSVITVLGDAANVTARLAGLAGPGEILVSEETHRRAGLPDRGDARDVEIRGRDEVLSVRSLRAGELTAG